MFSVCVTAMLVGQPARGPVPLPKDVPYPAALVMGVSGPVQAADPSGRWTEVQHCQRIWDGTVVRVPAGGSLKLIRLENGEQVEVRPGAKVTVGQAGITPADAVTPRGRPIP